MFGTRWQSFDGVRSDLNRLQSEMERMFGTFTAVAPRCTAHGAYPALNVWEEDDSLRVEAELPGIDLDNLEIFVDDDNQLTIKGERTGSESEDETWHRRERGFGKFERAIELQQEVDKSKVTAEYKHGILTVTLPKREEVKPRRIQVKVG